MFLSGKLLFKKFRCLRAFWNYKIVEEYFVYYKKIKSVSVLFQRILCSYKADKTKAKTQHRNSKDQIQELMHSYSLFIVPYYLFYLSHFFKLNKSIYTSQICVYTLKVIAKVIKFNKGCWVGFIFTKSMSALNSS